MTGERRARNVATLPNQDTSSPRLRKTAGVADLHGLARVAETFFAA